MDLPAFEALALPSLTLNDDDDDDMKRGAGAGAGAGRKRPRETAGEEGRPCAVVVVDEVGKMELFSAAFQTRVAALLDHPGVLVLGSVPMPRYGREIDFVGRIKCVFACRPDRPGGTTVCGHPLFLTRRTHSPPPFAPWTGPAWTWRWSKCSRGRGRRRTRRRSGTSWRRSDCHRLLDERSGFGVDGECGCGCGCRKKQERREGEKDHEKKSKSAAVLLVSCRRFVF